MKTAIRLVILFLAVTGVAPAGALAAAVTPTAPANGAQFVEADNVVLSWTLAPGYGTECIEWANRPETRYPGGPFLAPAGGDCQSDPSDSDTHKLVNSPDTSYLLSLYDETDDDLIYGRVYWHVRAGFSCRDADGYVYSCISEYSATAMFSNILRPYVPKWYLPMVGQSKLEVKPRAVYPSGTGGAPIARHVRWIKWAKPVVRTRWTKIGIQYLRPRDSIATGRYHFFKGYVRAYRPRKCDGDYIYTRLRYVFAHRPPKRIGSAKTYFGGRPWIFSCSEVRRQLQAP